MPGRRPSLAERQQAPERTSGGAPSRPVHPRVLPTCRAASVGQGLEEIYPRRVCLLRAGPEFSVRCLFGRPSALPSSEAVFLSVASSFVLFASQLTSPRCLFFLSRVLSAPLSRRPCSVREPSCNASAWAISVSSAPGVIESLHSVSVCNLRQVADGVPHYEGASRPRSPLRGRGARSRSARPSFSKGP